MLGTIRRQREISERTDYGSECVTARRYVGIFGKQLEFGKPATAAKRKIIRNSTFMK